MRILFLFFPRRNVKSKTTKLVVDAVTDNLIEFCIAMPKETCRW